MFQEIHFSWKVGRQETFNIESEKIRWVKSDIFRGNLTYISNKQENNSRVRKFNSLQTQCYITQNINCDIIIE